ncbi:DUF1489 domain-containing protein [Brevundimonas sp.]|uniref:DUF1489 domain-containing protein n=1 Tax=Brevundimonas sp. TaxID=1871086 RepID=UPI00356A3641
MIKLCVGVARVETLERRVGKGDWLTVHTRMTPKRAAELEDGGSIYWVMKGSVTCRMPIADITTRGEGKAGMCHIRLRPEVVRTAPQARRPFQGWRYLELRDAPMDLSSLDAGEVPVDLARRLREMGAW